MDDLQSRAPGPSLAAELQTALARGVDAVVPGASPGGPSSRRIDATTTPMRILREGAVRIDVTAL